MVNNGETINKFIGVPVANNVKHNAIRANNYTPTETNGVYGYDPRIWLLAMTFRLDDGDVIQCAAKNEKGDSRQDVAIKSQIREAVLDDLQKPMDQRRRFEIEFRVSEEGTFRNNYVIGYKVLGRGPSTTAAPAPSTTMVDQNEQWMAVEVNPVANSIRRSVAFKAASDRATEMLRAMLIKIEVEPVDTYLDRIGPLLKEIAAIEYELTDEAERILLRLPLSDGYEPTTDEPDDNLFDDGGGV